MRHAQVLRDEWESNGTVELREVKARQNQVEFRKAVVYPVANPQSKPTVWRLSIYRIPEPPGGQWNGGRVMWHCDSTDRDVVEAAARRWVADEIYP